MSILDATLVGPLAPAASWVYTFADKITPPDLVMPLLATSVRVTTATRTSVTFTNAGASTAPAVTFWLVWFYGEITRDVGLATLGWQGGDVALPAGTATTSYVDQAILGAGLLAPDSHDLLRFKLDEAPPLIQHKLRASDSAVLWDVYGPFADDIGGRAVAFVDTLPTAADSNTYQVQVPGIGNHKAFGTWGGTLSQQRDYLQGLQGFRPVLPITCSLWIKPHGFSEGRVESIFQREYRVGTTDPTSETLGDGAWTAPFVSLQMYFSNANDGTWGAIVTTGGVAHILDCSNNTQGFRQRVLPRDGVWNHLGFTYDGTILKLFCNGLAGPTLVMSGAIDYNGINNQAWVFGGNIPTAAGLDRLSASISEFRVADIARPVSYFEQMYASNLRIV